MDNDSTVYLGSANSSSSERNLIFGKYQSFLYDHRDEEGNYYCKIIKNDKFKKKKK